MIVAASRETFPLPLWMRTHRLRIN